MGEAAQRGEPPVAGPPEPELPGPFPVGRYAARLRERFRGYARLRLIGEVAGLGRGRAGHCYFELRDADGAVPCAMWATDLERMRLPDGALRDGVQVLVSGGLDYYPGSATASPRMSFRVTHLRLAGEGDLLARLAELRRRLAAEGLLTHQERLPRPALPRAIGVVTAESGAARRDLLAGLERRGWRGTVIWAFAPVQDRHAAPAVTRAVADLAALPEVEAIIVCRGGGSLADLWAFCDEHLCRTVALLATPVISAVGHETDHTLIDDVAAVACSTPTHAAEAAVRIDCARARSDQAELARRLARNAVEAVARRGRRLAALARVPAERVRRERRRLHQDLREVRAATQRALRERGRLSARLALVVDRKARAAVRDSERARARALGEASGLERAADATMARRRRELERAAVALRAHDPKRTLERGFVLVEDPGGEPLTSAAAAARHATVALRFADGRLRARPEERIPSDEVDE